MKTKKEWTRPELTVIRRTDAESVLTVCKTKELHGPQSGGCEREFSHYCCFQVGLS